MERKWIVFVYYKSPIYSFDYIKENPKILKESDMHVFSFFLLLPPPNVQNIDLLFLLAIDSPFLYYSSAIHQNII
jgi:hypothetical protein